MGEFRDKLDKLTNRLRKYGDKLEQENKLRKQQEQSPTLNQQAEQALKNVRAIICGNIAVITCYDTASLMTVVRSMNPPEPSEHDRKIATVLAAVLKSNPTADLSPYEESFSIKITSVQLLKNRTPDDGGMPIGEAY
jgi:hypothetical protein